MDKNLLCKAVRKLRLASGETQQEFAYRMKTAISTIARWETVRPPKGKALTSLIKLARETGCDDIVLLFIDSLYQELGLDDLEDLKSMIGILDAQ